MNVVYLVLGGSAGTLSRYYIGLWITNATGARAPATLLINVLGSFVIGLFLQLGADRSAWSNGLVLLVAVGFLGGFTTFSTFAWQTLQLMEGGEMTHGLLNIAASLGLGMAAVWLGATLARVLA
jgi:CrcB protein